MFFLKTWEFWSIVIFFAPVLLVAGLAGRTAFKKGTREAYYLLAFCLMLCAAVYANKVLEMRMTGTVGFEGEKKVLDAKTETINARDEVRQMKIEVEQARASVIKVEKELRELSETMYAANRIILHGMNYMMSHVFRVAAAKEMKKLGGKFGHSQAEIDKRIDLIIQQAEKEHQRVWSEYEKVPDDKKEKFLNDYMRKAQE